MHHKTPSHDITDAAKEKLYNSWAQSREDTVVNLIPNKGQTTSLLFRDLSFFKLESPGRCRAKHENALNILHASLRGEGRGRKILRVVLLCVPAAVYREGGGRRVGVSLARRVDMSGWGLSGIINWHQLCRVRLRNDFQPPCQAHTAVNWADGRDIRKYGRNEDRGKEWEWGGRLRGPTKNVSREYERLSSLGWTHWNIIYNHKTSEKWWTGELWKRKDNVEPNEVNCKYSSTALTIYFNTDTQHKPRTGLQGSVTLLANTTPHDKKI